MKTIEKEIDDALHMLLHCALKDKEYVTQRQQYEIVYRYILSLEEKIREKDNVIYEIEKRCNQEISAATIQYERYLRSDTWQYIIAHKRILKILKSGGKMLKIKDNVDLKKLEKFGFKKLNIIDHEKIIAENVYCLVDNEDIEFIKNNTIDRFLVQYYFDIEGYQVYCTYPEERNEGLINDTNFDLIKADLVEKVENMK